MASINDHIYIRRDKSMNLIHLIRDREHGIDRRHYVHHRKSKDFCADFFKCFTPNLTITNVEKHFNYIRKFTPDGKFLICFSRDQLSFECYKFLGTTTVSPLLYQWKTEFIPPDVSYGLGGLIRHNIFNELFRLHWSIQLSSTIVCPLYREFSIFTEDGIYVIIASHTPIAQIHTPSYYAMNSINPMHTEFDLFSYRFFMIELRNGSISDTTEFLYDFIKLSHNHGVSVKGNLMVVVSLLHQHMYVVKLKEGTFIRLYTIGSYPHGIKDCLCEHTPEYEECCQMLDNGLSGFKQKIIIFLYRRVLKYEPKSKLKEVLRLFYQRLYIFEAMQINKLQFIDEDHLLIRYDLHQHPEVKTDIKHKFFVFYNLVDDEILKVGAENDSELLWFFVNFCDVFRDARSIYTGRTPSSSNNNIQIRFCQKRIINAIPGGYFVAAYKLLPQLPLAMQTYSVSPYLDLNLFSYETQLISALEKPKIAACAPIPFYDRETNLLLFHLHLGIYNNKVAPSQNRGIGEAAAAMGGSPNELVTFVFHPFEPFFISIQRLDNRYITNFHIRNEGTFVKTHLNMNTALPPLKDSTVMW